MEENDAVDKVPRWTKSELGIAALISVVALVFAVAHLLFPATVVDSVTVGLLVVAAAPWLGPLMARYFKSLKAPGGWEVEFQQLREEVVTAKGVAQDASLLATTALTTTVAVL